jgi:hypothetical protein
MAIGRVALDRDRCPDPPRRVSRECRMIGFFLSTDAFRTTALLRFFMLAPSWRERPASRQNGEGSPPRSSRSAFTFRFRLHTLYSMARGWGRSEEDLGAEKEQAREEKGSADGKRRNSGLEAQRRTLRLSLARIEEQLAKGLAGARRQALESAREELQKRLAELDP